jgi:hypothetical protein
MTKYQESDCRNNAARMRNPVAVSQAQFVIETNRVNRHERRKQKALIGRKNIVGVPLGFNQRTWAEHCAKFKGVQ